MLLCGIDENGLGPMLGPLVVTGVVLELPDYRPAALGKALAAAARALPGGAGCGVGDSKRTLGFARMAEGEPVVLGMLAAALGGLPPTFSALFRRVSLLPEARLQSECPPGALPMCWAPDLALPLWSASAAPDGGGGAVRAALARRSARIVDVGVATSCPGWFNRDLARGTARNKLHLEFALIEGLLERFRARGGERLTAHCGRLGGTRTGYPEFFDALRGDRWSGPFEQPGVVTYAFERMGDVSFVDHAETRHPAVALASMIGKYVREGFMLRLNRYFGAGGAGLRPTSGYFNPVTDAFVAGTAASRREHGIPDACFVRTR